MLASRTSALSALRVAAVFAVAALAVPLARAQPRLGATVAAGGAADASGAGYRVRATVGQALTGQPARRGYRVAQGFWPGARPTGRLVLAALPVGAPIVVAPGDKFLFDARFTVPAGGPPSFQYWATITAPSGGMEPGFGPVTVLVSPPTVQVVPTLQVVSPTASAGEHRYVVYAGTYPATVLASDGFTFTVTPDIVIVASARTPAPPGTDTRLETAHRRGTGRAADVAFARTAAPAPTLAAVRPETVGDGAQAFADGRPLLAGTVLDLRDASLAAADSLGETDTMAPPEEASAVVLPPEASASVAAEVPEALTLASPFPNPTRSGATFRFGLPAPGRARLVVYDAHGRTVAVLADGEWGAGWHTATVAADRLASGLYLVRLDVDGIAVTHRFTVLR